MKQKLIIACFFMIYIITLPVFCYGSENPGLPNATVQDDRYEFAPVLDGTKIVHDFVIINKGNAVLEIGKVETG